MEVGGITKKQPPVSSQESSPTLPLVDDVEIRSNILSLALLLLGKNAMPLQFSLSVLKVLDWGAFHIFQQTLLQALRPFPLIGII